MRYYDHSPLKIKYNNNDKEEFQLVNFYKIIYVVLNITIEKKSYNIFLLEHGIWHG